MTDKPDAHGWLPIDSAPKDGRDVLTWIQHGPDLAEFFDKLGVARTYPKEGTARVGYWHDGSDGLASGWRGNQHPFRLLGPTHWQPLPEPPEAA